jgi:DNA-directed RNA polymerase subunit beta'
MKEKYLFVPPTPRFTNKVIDKKELKRLMAWAFSNYGTGRASYMADRLKELGFHYATRAGISLSVEDLRVPPTKRNLLDKTNKAIQLTEEQYERGEITAIERFQRVIDTWNNASEELKTEVIRYFRETDPLNPIYIMAFSGARGNISQVRQLVGMRGLMADPQGQIIDLPIKSNFREGLTVTEYIISSYGARKGLVDTALRTADSGYLTRRLVDVAQDIIIREIDCGTQRNIIIKDMIANNQILIPIGNRLVGRVLFETLYYPHDGGVIAHVNQDLDHETSKLIVDAGIKSVSVRSPLTCDSARSVCQFCYGWNLAHGSLVDLGEAVGIIAAQSIGEPGTQLTMRTFHTGGVFTGELAEQIKAPFDGIIRIPRNLRSRLIRTRHGQEAIVLEASYKLSLYDYQCNERKIEFTQGTILFINDNEQFQDGQVIGEISTKTNPITERATKDLLTESSGEVFFSELTAEERVDRQGNITTKTGKGGLIWILSGEVHNLPQSAQLEIKEGDEISEDTILATTHIISDYGGTVRLNKKKQFDELNEIHIVTSSVFIKDAVIKNEYETDETTGNFFLDFSNGNKFIMLCSPGNKINSSQIIGELVDTEYKTKTGGLIRYQNTLNDVGDTHHILWIPEETHEIKKDISLLMVRNNTYVEAGTEIIKDVRTENSGYLEVIEENGIVEKLIIKIGRIIENTINAIEKDNILPRIIEAGEEIQAGILADSTSLIEKIPQGILIRPIDKYYVDKKQFQVETKHSINGNQSININLVQHLLFQEGERIESIKGIDLVKTYLTVDICSDQIHGSADVEFLGTNKSGEYRLQIAILENLQIKHDTFGENNKQNTKTVFCVSDGEEITSGTLVAKTSLISRSKGKIENINNNGQSGKKILILRETDKEIIDLNGQTPQVSEGELVRYGDQIAPNIVARESGQITALRNNKVEIRSAHPYLVSSGAILQTKNRDLIQIGDTLAILVFERSKTGDIIQGLPRIEEILEARRPKEACKLTQRPGKIKVWYDAEENYHVEILEADGNINEYVINSTQKVIVSNGENILLAEAITDGAPNPHEMLSLYFNFYISVLGIYEASKLSLQKVQTYLVNEVQNVYQSQNVEISDKHVEVIVRQMTSKVRVEDGGDTTLLPGELVELQQIENINEAMLLTRGIPATYSPTLLGITKSSLNTDSFISAASFQETTRVLTEAAIEGKADWLRGLKENVIIGRLIPAGTGFNSYTEMSKISRDEKKTKDGYYFDNKNSNKRIVHIGVNEDSEYLQDDLKVK